MYHDRFASRHIGPRCEELKSMLEKIGAETIEELVASTVPREIRTGELAGIPAQGWSEGEFLSRIREIASRNRPLRTFIGQGFYPSETPAPILRNILENPGWYTPYTPYQAEISQGRLEALLNFQTMICSMTGLPLANCSLLDEATAAAEAVNVMLNQRSRTALKETRKRLFVDRNLFPQNIDVIHARAEPLGIEVTVADYESYSFQGDEFGAVVQYPAADGKIRNYGDFTALCHEKEVLVTAVCDLLALALLRPPGDWGADIAVGSTQRFGLPMGYGGPAAGYMAAKEDFKRNLPGRIIGFSVDRLGNPALRMALQTREQHIKRERATSNICTAQALTAVMSGFFAVYHGPDGIYRIAASVHRAACWVRDRLLNLGIHLSDVPFFDTLRLEGDSAVVKNAAERAGLNFHYPDEQHIQISLDQKTTPEELERIVGVFETIAGKKSTVISQDPVSSIPSELSRQTAFLTEKVFNLYHSETELMRYMKRLERKDISLADSMIPLGSCTMKLNPAASMLPLSFPEFGDVHPFVPAEQAAGYRELIGELEHDLAVITGMDAVSVQPNSGAAGEYAGLLVIRAYQKSQDEGHRNIVLIPSSAHGTNPASAVMAGLKVIVVHCDNRGNIDVEDLRKKAEEHSRNLSCIMVTYPSTHGVFESRIREIVDIVHRCGGQVYLDGANMNAQVGLTHPGKIGADVCHLNLHKTFAMPHGGGGPGVGPIAVAGHLSPFLPGHSVCKTGGDKAIRALASGPWGSAWRLPITYSYIKMMGADGLRQATEIAILNANYMAAMLQDEFSVVYTGENGRVGHEMIVDLRNFRHEYGVDSADVARRLADYGFHAPTLSFPVAETLMVEPTESESKAEMDRFVEALIQIKRECEAIRDGRADPHDNPLKNAPHTAAELSRDQWEHPYGREKAAYPLPWVSGRKFWPSVSRIDAGYGDRNLICRWEETDRPTE